MSQWEPWENLSGQVDGKAMCLQFDKKKIQGRLLRKNRVFKAMESFYYIRQYVWRGFTYASRFTSEMKNEGNMVLRLLFLNNFHKLNDLNYTLQRLRLESLHFLTPSSLWNWMQYKNTKYSITISCKFKKKTSDSAVSWLLIRKIIYMIQFAARGGVNIYTFAYKYHTFIGMKSSKLQTQQRCLLTFPSNFKWNEFWETRQDSRMIKDS